MSPSLVDKVRESPPTDRRSVTVIGVDPDIHTLGIASAVADIGGGMPLVCREVMLSSLTNKPPKRSTQTAITEAMCKMLEKQQLGWMYRGLDAYAVVETQVFYPKKDMERAKMVSIANAMIAIATITGRAMSLALQAGMKSRMVTPNVWKGTRSKDADHARSAGIVGNARVILIDSSNGQIQGASNGLPDLPDYYEHALDGLGIALYGMEQLHRGTWK